MYFLDYAPNIASRIKKFINDRTERNFVDLNALADNFKSTLPTPSARLKQVRPVAKNLEYETKNYQCRSGEEHLSTPPPFLQE